MVPRGKKMSGQKPIAKFKAGTVSAAVFENEIPVKEGKATVLKVTVQKRYKDSDGNWKSSNSYSRNEIPLAIHCLQKAFESMLGESDTNGENADEEIVM